MPDLDMAVVIAEHCLIIPQVKEVWLFGRVAEKGSSDHDIDMVLVVDDEVAKDFCSITAEIPDDFYDKGESLYLRLELRKSTAERCIGAIVPPDLEKTCRVDVFLFPDDWRKKARSLERFLNNSDGFVRRIASNARRYNSSTRSFEVISS
jgi:predicted nucleotidyltransferase